MKFKLSRALLIGMVLGTLLVPPAVFAEQTQTSSSGDMDYLKSVSDFIKENYGGKVDDKQLMEGTLRGMFGSMDPYTSYFNQTEADQHISSIGGKYVGIGAQLSKPNDDSILVSGVFQSSPAEKAGIVAGDRIVSVDGKSVNGISPDQVVTWIQGEKGTQVTLGIVKTGTSGAIDIKVTREEIKVNPVSYEIRNGIGYIRIDSFNGNTAENFNNALKVMDDNKISKIVLDLRNNPGGEVSQAVEVAKKFVPEGLITKLDFKSDNFKDQEYRSDLKASKYKLVVLVNGRSASASEIVSGAIQDTKAGTLVGTKTFGKAKVQDFIPLLSPEAYKKYEGKYGVKILNAYDIVDKYNVEPSEDEIIGWTKMTVGYYYTPKGRMIDLVGINPDVQIDDPKNVGDIDVNSVHKLSKTVKPGLNGESIDVYNAERILKVSGYDVDTPDSKLDTKTFEAIKKFQKDSGLNPYGTLDFSTQQALNDRLDTAIMIIDKQYTKAVLILNGSN